MQNRNIKSIVILAVTFVITLYISLTYFWTGNFNVFSFSKNLGVLFVESENVDYNEAYIETNEIVEVTGPNGWGISHYAYTLNLKKIPKNIISVSVAFDDKAVSVGDIKLVVTRGESVEDISVSNGNIRDCKVLKAVNLTDVDMLMLESSCDNNGGEIANAEVLSVSKIKINSPEDISAIKKDLIFSVIKSAIVSLIIILIGIIILKSKIDKKLFKKNLNIAKVFLVTSLTVGVVFAFLFPVFQVPDEQTHINLIYGELNWNMKLSDYASDFADTSRIVANYDQKVNFSTYLNFAVKAQQPEVFALPSLSIIKHLPQAIGLVVCSLLGLPVFAALVVSELCAVVVYSIFGYLTIKLMPFKKELITAILLLPIMLQEFPSLSYDSFLIASFYLFFAYSMHVKFIKEKFTLPDLGILLALLAVIAITKIPYALAAVLILLIPISKIDFNFGLFRIKGEFILKHKLIFSISAGVIVVLGALAAVKVLQNILIGRVLIAAIYSLKNAIVLFAKTIIAFFGRWLVELTGNFGWFDTPVALVFTVFVMANLLFLNLFDNYNVLGKPQEKNPFKPLEITVMFVFGILMSLITILALFEHTTTAFNIDISNMSIPEIASCMNMLPYIGGVQGRYFIPVIPMLLVPLYFAKPATAIGRINHKSYLCMYNLIVFTYVGIVVLMRYWI